MYIAFFVKDQMEDMSWLSTTETSTSFGLKLSPTSPKIVYPSHSSRIVYEKKIIIQNTKTKEKSTPKKSHRS